jgi:predicted GIY-YIG superfamily endonuclease
MAAMSNYPAQVSNSEAIVMPYCVYILRCSDGSYYTGVTNDLDGRVAQHNEGKGGGYTMRRRPVKLLFSEEFGTAEEAIRAEKQLKGWSRAKKEALMAGDFELISRLARGRTKSQTKKS